MYDMHYCKCITRHGHLFFYTPIGLMLCLMNLSTCNLFALWICINTLFLNVGSDMETNFRSLDRLWCAPNKIHCPYRILVWYIICIIAYHQSFLLNPCVKFTFFILRLLPSKTLSKCVSLFWFISVFVFLCSGLSSFWCWWVGVGV